MNESDSPNPVIPVDGLSHFKTQCNAIDFATLIKAYENVNFLYPAKKTKLDAHWEIIGSNWDRTLNAGNLIHQLLTYGDPESRTWASVSSWRTTHNGWLVQHMVSRGNPTATWHTLLSCLSMLHHDLGAHWIQNWFRPTNRFPNRLFSKIVSDAGSEYAGKIVLDFFSIDPALADGMDSSFRAVVWRRDLNKAFLDLVEGTRGPVYLKAEELDHRDPLLEEVDVLYRFAGLRRYRRIFLVEEQDRLLGAAIANRGPLGLNFSFIENRCDLIVSDSTTDVERIAVAEALLIAIRRTYTDFEAPAIPICTDANTGDLLEGRGAKRLRQYAQSAWSREANESAWESFSDFFRPVIRRMERGQQITTTRIKGIYEEDVDWFLLQGQERVYAEGERLLMEDVRPEGLFVLLAGSVSVHRSGKGEIARRQAGQTLGEMSYLTNSTASATVIAEERCLVSYVAFDDIDRKFADSPEFASRTLKNLGALVTSRLREI